MVENVFFSVCGHNWLSPQVEEEAENNHATNKVCNSREINNQPNKRTIRVWTTNK